jgi:hypothetical protein
LSIFDSLFGSNATTTTQQQQLSGPAANVATSLFDRAQTFANQPYSQYEGPRTAWFNEDQYDAFGRTRNIANNSQGLMGTLQNRVTGDMAGRQDGTMRALAGNATGAANASADLMSGPLAQTFNNVDLSGYMNPYVQAVLDPAIADLTKQADLRRNQLSANAVRTGSFGGSRNALAAAENDRNTSQEIGRLSANERARAFNEGADQFRKDQTALPGLFNAIAQTNLTGQQGITNEGAYQQQGYQNLNNLLSANQQQYASQVNPLLATGGLQQALMQGHYDTYAQDFRDRRDWDARGLSALQSALGVGSGATGMTTTGSTEAPRPNAIGQVLGAGTGLLGSLGGLTSAANNVSNLWNTASGWFGGGSDLSSFATPTSYIDAGGFGPFISGAGVPFRTGGLVSAMQM